MIKKRSLLMSLLILIIMLTIHSQSLAQQSTPSAQLPLTADGPYKSSIQVLTLVDSSRDNEKLAISVWYPAQQSVDLPAEGSLTSGPAMAKAASPLKQNASLKGPSTGDLEAGDPITILEIKGRWAHVKAGDATGWVLSDNVINAPSDPDMSHAPYPLILYSHGLGGSRWDDPSLFAHLASQGFVVAAIDHDCDSEPTCLIDRPMDILFVLNQLAGNDKGKLAGVVASDNAGVLGVSYGGYTALATTGARIDPTYFLNWYSQRNIHVPASVDVLDSYRRWHIMDEWANIAAYSAKVLPADSSDLWPAMTDSRVRAVMPIIPAASNLFGEHGLEAATKPTLFMVATEDQIIPYNDEVVPMWTHFGAKERYLISLIGYDHRTYLNPNWGSYYPQFTTAFFGYYLQGKSDYAQYLTADYVNQFSDLAWGLYKGK